MDGFQCVDGRLLDIELRPGQNKVSDKKRTVLCMVYVIETVTYPKHQTLLQIPKILKRRGGSYNGRWRNR